MEDFTRAAARYKAKHKTWAVIIIDNPNEIPENDPSLLIMLQKEAKMAADNGPHKIAPATSDGRAPEMMKRESQYAAACRRFLIIRADKSAWSRGSDTCRTMQDRRPDCFRSHKLPRETAHFAAARRQNHS